jgi:hypothetical protein
MVIRPDVAVAPPESFAISAFASAESADAVRGASSIPVPTPSVVMSASRRVIDRATTDFSFSRRFIFRLILNSNSPIAPVVGNIEPSVLATTRWTPASPTWRRCSRIRDVIKRRVDLIYACAIDVSCAVALTPHRIRRCLRQFSWSVTLASPPRRR